MLDLKNGYNNAANILSDNHTFFGIDIVKFEDNINIIKKDKYLKMDDLAIETYKDYYHYEEIDGSYRKKLN